MFLSYGRANNRINFKPRVYQLKKLENDYGKFILSCRHKDMLNCSRTKHFQSCYRPDGAYSHVPFRLCANPNYAIIGKKDRSGQFIWRAFVKYVEYSGYLKVYKIYGNPPPDTVTQIFDKLKRVSFYEMDATGDSND